jgi:valyl-tRNA synthetase
VLSSTIQDVFVRWHRMLGRETLWWPGTDHAGIATQKVVERALRDQGTDPVQLGREAFIARCWEWKERSHRHIVAQMQRIGWALDWQREYFTLDEPRSHAVREAFIRLYRKGLIYRGRYITNWCPTCRTAISDEEVENEEVRGELWTVRYPRADGQGFVEIATTRPETILGDVAVAIHPDDPRAAALVGVRLRLPILDREIPIVADPDVDPEFGTGMVKLTPAHDANDFRIGQRHGLEMPVVMDPGGRMNELAGPLRGLDRFEARKQVLERLTAAGLLVRSEPHTFTRGVHDRCHTIIEPYLSDQWFVRMQPLAEPALRAAESGRVSFYPERWRNVYLHWMRNIHDWCISRQLWWGHRIPVYTCGGCATQVAAHAPPAACAQCGGTGFTQDEDVLDTWFSSWLCPLSPMGWPQRSVDLERYHPTTLLVTGPDIIFFWVARMIMASLEFAGDIPFGQVLLHGILRDARGRKLSKSLGNSPDPLELVERHGADALRFALVMLSPPGQDLFFDEKNVITGRNFANKIWNAARFVLDSVEARGLAAPLGLAAAPAAPGGPTRPEDGFAALWWEVWGRRPPAQVLEGARLEDRWILDGFSRAAGEVNREMRALRANEAASRLYHFFWDDYCAWYLESIKPRFYGDDPDSSRTAHAVALLLLAQACRLLGPFMPHLAEELWSRIPGTEGLVLTAPYPQESPPLRDAAAERFGWVQEAAGAIRTLRSEMGVPPGKKAPGLVRSAAGGLAIWEGETGALLCLHAKLTGLTPTSERPAAAVSVVVQDTVLYVPLEELVDLDAERQRLARDLSRVDADLARLESKLGNPEFVGKARPEIVEHERARHVDLRTRRERLQGQLQELSGKD